METTSDDTWDLCLSELIDNYSVLPILSLTKSEAIHYWISQKQLCKTLHFFKLCKLLADMEITAA